VLKKVFLFIILLCGVALAQTDAAVVPRTFEYSTLVLDYDFPQFFWVGEFGIIGPYKSLLDLSQVITGATATFDDEALTMILNHAGSYNWEVVTVLESGNRFRFVLKRSFE
jgi:hypothetical protein